MPEMNGIEACRQIKAVERFRDTPIMVTVKTDPSISTRLCPQARSTHRETSQQIELLTRIRSVLRLVHEIERRQGPRAGTP